MHLADEEQNHKEIYEIYLDESIRTAEMSDNLTFCAEMPDEGSYGRAFWRVTYTCHLQSFENDWQLVIANFCGLILHL